MAQLPQGRFTREQDSILTVVVLFAARYKAVESEAASMLLVSTLALVVTVPTILWLSH
jgi:hypothetical protein